MALFGPSKATKAAANSLREATSAAEAKANTAFQAGLDFQRSFGSRNKDLLKLQRATGKQIADFTSGKDVSGIFKGNASVLRAAARQNRALMEMTSGMGSNALAKSDPRYMAKLRSLGQSRADEQYGNAMLEGALTQHAGNIQTLGNLQSALTQDQLSGLTALNQGFANAANVAGLYGNQFTAQSNLDAQRRAGIMGMINLGLGAVTGIGGLMKK